MSQPGQADAFMVPVDAAGDAVTALHYAPGQPAGATFIVAHGAGAGQHSPFMTSFALAMAASGLDTITFNFPFTEAKRRLPDRAPVLEACYAAVIRATTARVASARAWLFIGGKSMGGRMATQLVAADRSCPAHGLVLLGYPLHPPGKPQQRRDAHLPGVGRPMLFVQGSRDAFGTPEELQPVLTALMPPAALHVVAGGDHSFTVARAGTAGQQRVQDEVRQACAQWMRGIMRAGC